MEYPRVLASLTSRLTADNEMFNPAPSRSVYAFDLHLEPFWEMPLSSGRSEFKALKTVISLGEREHSEHVAFEAAGKCGDAWDTRGGSEPRRIG